MRLTVFLRFVTDDGLDIASVRLTTDDCRSYPPQPGQTLIPLHHLREILVSVRTGIFCLANAKRSKIARDRTLQMPSGQCILLSSCCGFRFALTAHCVGVLVDSHRNTNLVRLKSGGTTRTGDLETRARFAVGRLSSIRIGVLGLDVGCDVKAESIVSAFVGLRQRQNVHRHDHLLGLAQAVKNKAHLLVETLHAILAAPDALVVFIVDELVVADFAGEDHA